MFFGNLFNNSNKSEKSKIETIDLLIEYLKKSEDSVYSAHSVDELIELVKNCKEAYITGDKFAFEELFLPTNSLQDTAIDNGWGNEFIQFSSVLVAS